ncbi:ATP-dependent zinc metalloprotease YME1L1 [Strongylocentrotus purpuratus]|uniref:AAA+ ATPase domain-containing protein n=1 Tax=Strongylocentrotus purpuratus TaxID=7668 RepID=A0A7M7RH35_STRPU|nr:ATP-dependent zinc metalloprotease YME1L1 [Strongylocentrotus purpuratus]
MFSVSGVNAQQLVLPLPHLVAAFHSLKGGAETTALRRKQQRTPPAAPSTKRQKAEDTKFAESLSNVTLNLADVGVSSLPKDWLNSILPSITEGSNLRDRLQPQSYTSAESFFENKHGFPAAHLAIPTFNEITSSAGGLQSFRHFLDANCSSSHPLLFDQRRGFKTKRAASATELTTRKSKEEDVGLTGLFRRFTSSKDPKKKKFRETLGDALSSHNDHVADKDSFKTGYLEGYMLGKDETKKSDRFKGWTTVLIFGVLAYLYVKMVSVFARVSIIGNSNVDSMTVADVTFDDVRGADEAKNELQDIVNYLKDPSKYTVLGGKLPKGVLLQGSPGVGKTLLARAVAGEANVPFYYASGSDFDNMFVGSGAKRVRDIFTEAKNSSPCLIFIDELDSVGGKRVDSPLHPYARQTINQLLSEMDGFKQNEGIVVLAATNFPESLDPALTRPGRFDMKVVVPRPDVKGRQDILDLYLGQVKVSSKVDVETLARGTVGFTGADLQNLVNQAALEAARKGKESVEMKDLEFSKDKILMGPERKSAQVDPRNRKITAYHEGGHALVAVFTKDAKPINKATIMPRGPTLGHVSLLPDNDQWSETKSQLLAQMDVCMGGRVAEELIFGPENITTGASSDFEQATRIAHLMVTKFGMSEKVGVMTYQDRDPLVYGDSNKLSPETQLLIENEIRTLLKDSYERARTILKTRSKEHNLLAEALLQYETLNAVDISKVIKGQMLDKR